MSPEIIPMKSYFIYFVCVPLDLIKCVSTFSIINCTSVGAINRLFDRFIWLKRSNAFILFRAWNLKWERKVVKYYPGGNGDILLIGRNSTIADRARLHLMVWNQVSIMVHHLMLLTIEGLFMYLFRHVKCQIVVPLG